MFQQGRLEHLCLNLYRDFQPLQTHSIWQSAVKSLLRRFELLVDVN